MPILAVLHSTIRKEEKLILEAARRNGFKVKLIDIRQQIFHPDHFCPDFDIALERSVSTIKGSYTAAFLDSLGIPVINPPSVARICEDKLITSLALKAAGISTPRFALVFDIHTAETAVADLGGYPVVLKPPRGSWGRLLAKVNDAEALEAVLEHKQILGSPPHKAFYLQEYIPKPEYDIRTFVLGREVICAIARRAGHWITNTARGASAVNYPLNSDLEKICRETSEAVGPGILAVDLFETPYGYLVNEVNHTMEFRNSEEPTGVSISQAIISYCREQISEC